MDNLSSKVMKLLLALQLSHFSGLFGVFRTLHSSCPYFYIEIDISSVEDSIIVDNLVQNSNIQNIQLTIKDIKAVQKGNYYQMSSWGNTLPQNTQPPFASPYASSYYVKSLHLDAQSAESVVFLANIINGTIFLVLSIASTSFWNPIDEWLVKKSV